jgi:1,4-dihydroxy-2-naphthoate octaprenyltransferase
MLLLYGWTNMNIIICFIPYFLFVQSWSKMRQIGQGRALNKVLGMTARNIFVYGLLISLLIILT